jgi:hypothetical protein
MKNLIVIQKAIRQIIGPHIHWMKLGLPLFNNKIFIQKNKHLKVIGSFKTLITLSCCNYLKGFFFLMFLESVLKKEPKLLY